MSDYGKKRKRRLPPFDLVRSLRFAQRILDELDIPYVLIGRYAVWSWVSEETEHELTKDIDFAVKREDLPLIERKLEEETIKLRFLPIGGINVHYPDEKINVDFIDRTSKKYGDLGLLYSDAIDYSEEIIDIEGMDVPLISAEHLIAIKIASARRKDEDDVMRMMEYPEEEIDVSMIRDLLREYVGVAAMGRFEMILEEVGHPEA